MLNWMNPQWQQANPNNAYSGMYNALFGGGGGGAMGARMTPWGGGSMRFQDSPNWKPNEFSPQAGTWLPNRNTLAQVMAPYQQPGYGRGNNPGYTSSRSYGRGASSPSDRAGMGGLSSGGLY